MIRRPGRRPWRPDRSTRHRDASRAHRPAPPRLRCLPSGLRFLFAAYRVTPRAAPSPCWRLHAPDGRHCAGSSDLQRIMHDRRSFKGCADEGGEAALTHRHTIMQHDVVPLLRPAPLAKQHLRGRGGWGDEERTSSSKAGVRLLHTACEWPRGLTSLLLQANGSACQRQAHLECGEGSKLLTDASGTNILSRRVFCCARFLSLDRSVSSGQRLECKAASRSDQRLAHFLPLHRFMTRHPADKVLTEDMTIA